MPKLTNQPLNISLENTCRCCLQNTAEFGLSFDLFQEYSFVDGLQNITPRHILQILDVNSLKVSISDGRPSRICSECMFLLTEIQTFRVKCSQAQFILNDFFDSQIKKEVKSTLRIETKTEVAKTVSCKNNNELEIIGEYVDYSEEFGLGKEDVEEESDAVSDPDTNSLAGDTKHVCEFCQKTFKIKQRLTLHIQRIHERGTFSCLQCSRVYTNKLNLKDHLRRMHYEPVKLECPTCQRCFDQEIRLRRHMKSHDPSKRIKCKYCPKSFIQRIHVRNHERTHTKERPFLCNICGKDYPLETSLKYHLETHNETRNYNCAICKKDFITYQSYYAHLRRHANADRFKCDECEKVYSSKSSLAKHMLVHSGKRPFECKVCGKTFIQRFLLEQHQFFNHNIYFKKFANRPTIKQQSGTYACTECGKTYKRAEQLRSHINVFHRKLRPYACSICPRTFTQYTDRYMHFRKHHPGEEPYKCEECQLAFFLPKLLSRHQRVYGHQKLDDVQKDVQQDDAEQELASESANIVVNAEVDIEYLIEETEIESIQ